MRIDTDDIYDTDFLYDENIDVIKFRPEEARKIFGVNFWSKVGRLNGHEKMPSDYLIENSEFEDEATCGRCSNCNGFQCGLYKIKKDLFTIIDDNIFYP